jgi:hypothetical protein
MKPVRLLPAVAFLLAAAPLARAGAQLVITEWNFETGSTSGVNTSPATYVGTGTATSVGMNADGNGDNSGLSSLAGTDGTNNSSSNQTWKVRGNNGWTPNAAIASQGAQFAVSTSGYSNISASFDWYPSTKGEADLAVEYTLNGTTWIDATASMLTLPTSSTLSLKTNTSAGNTWYNAITLNLSSIAGAANDPTFGLRLVNAATGADDVQASANSTEITYGSSGSGNWSFDDVTFTGVPIPEPSTYALILGAATLGLVLLRRRAARA